jgi:Transposase domain (DUF772)
MSTAQAALALLPSQIAHALPNGPKTSPRRADSPACRWRKGSGEVEDYSIAQARIISVVREEFESQLAILKHTYDLSDEAFRWVENPYFQYFCGEEFFQHALVVDRSSLTRWRQWMGEEKLKALLQESWRRQPGRTR